MKNFIRNHFTEFGLTVGAVVAILVAIVASAWDWMENPGGIFRGDEGTNWQFVFDTAFSWLVPTLMHTVVAASVAHLVWTGIAWVINKFTGRNQ